VSDPRRSPLTGRGRLLAWWSLLGVVGLIGFLALSTSSNDADRAGSGDGAIPSLGSAAIERRPDDRAGTDVASDEQPAADGDTAQPTDATSSTGSGTDPARDPSQIDPEFDDTTPNTFTTVPPADGCDPGYAGACIPLPPARVTCADIPERGIIVTGADLQGLDDDFDGTACPPDPIFVEADHPDEPLD